MWETAELVPEVEGDLSTARKTPQGLKPSLSFIPLSARVNSCPDTSWLFRQVSHYSPHPTEARIRPRDEDLPVALRGRGTPCLGLEAKAL